METSRWWCSGCVVVVVTRRRRTVVRPSRHRRHRASAARRTTPPRPGPRPRRPRRSSEPVDDSFPVLAVLVHACPPRPARAVALHLYRARVSRQTTSGQSGAKVSPSHRFGHWLHPERRSPQHRPSHLSPMTSHRCAKLMSWVPSPSRRCVLDVVDTRNVSPSDLGRSEATGSSPAGPTTSTPSPNSGCAPVRLSLDWARLQPRPKSSTASGSSGTDRCSRPRSAWAWSRG